MDKKKKRTAWQQCDTHRAEDSTWKDYSWDRGFCPQCLEHKVSLLWDKIFGEKNEED